MYIVLTTGPIYNPTELSRKNPIPHWFAYISRTEPNLLSRPDSVQDVTMSTQHHRKLPSAQLSTPRAIADLRSPCPLAHPLSSLSAIDSDVQIFRAIFLRTSWLSTRVVISSETSRLTCPDSHGKSAANTADWDKIQSRVNWRRSGCLVMVKIRPNRE